MHRSSWQPLVRFLAMFVLGGLVAASGTVLHRAYAPWGVALCLALVLASAVVSRAWVGLLGLLAYGIAWVVVVQVLSLTGPGGDVLIPAGEKIGYAWIIGGMLMVAVAAFAPRAWFAGELTAPAASEPAVIDPATIDADA